MKFRILLPLMTLACLILPGGVLGQDPAADPAPQDGGKDGAPDATPAGTPGGAVQQPPADAQAPPKSPDRVRPRDVKEAHKIAGTIIDASAGFPDHSLPELFSGYPRRQHSVPVPYPAAHVPQAWAAGALVHFLETILGVRLEGDQLLAAPFLNGIAASLDNVDFRGSRVSLG